MAAAGPAAPERNPRERSPHRPRPSPLPRFPAGPAPRARSLVAASAAPGARTNAPSARDVSPQRALRLGGPPAPAPRTAMRRVAHDTVERRARAPGYPGCGRTGIQAATGSLPAPHVPRLSTATDSVPFPLSPLHTPDTAGSDAAPARAGPSGPELRGAPPPGGAIATRGRPAGRALLVPPPAPHRGPWPEENLRIVHEMGK